MGGLNRFIGNFVLIIILFLILFSYAMFQGGFVSWFLFFSFLPIFLYQIGFLLYPITGWQVSRELSPSMAQAGDSLSITIKIKRKIPFPLYYCIVEEIFPDTLNRRDSRLDTFKHLDRPGMSYVNRQFKNVAFPGVRREITVQYDLEQIPRAVHRFKAIRIRTSDVFGLIKKERIFSVVDQLIVYPNEHPIPLNGQMSSREQGSISSPAWNRAHTDVATSAREYAPGDKMAWIDWKQTAKKNTMMTKEFEEEKSTDTFIVLDGCRYEGMNVLAFEAAIEVSLSVMEFFLRQGSVVDFVSLGEKVVRLPVHFDSTKAANIRNHLAQIQPGGIHSFSEQFKGEMGKGFRFSVMIVTTRIDDAFMQTLTHEKHRTNRMTVLLIQAENRITSTENMFMEQLQLEGISICVLTEKELMMSPIEVTI